MVGLDDLRLEVLSNWNDSVILLINVLWGRCYTCEITCSVHFLGRFYMLCLAFPLRCWKRFYQTGSSQQLPHLVCDLLRMVTHLWEEMTTSSGACSSWRGPELHMSGSFTLATLEVRHKYWLKITWLGQGIKALGLSRISLYPSHQCNSN